MIKTIIISISATIAIVFFTLSVALNSALGLFGLTSTSIASLKNFNTTRKELVKNKKKLAKQNKLVKKVKQRHKAKKLNISKKFAKRTGKKIASTAVSAATIGTFAVISTVAYLEINDYCEDKKELFEDEKILFGKSGEFNFKQCVKVATKDADVIMNSIGKETSDAVKKSWLSTKKAFGNKWKDLSSSGEELWDKTKDSVSSVFEIEDKETESTWTKIKNWF
jgi:hypothetical protein